MNNLDDRMQLAALAMARYPRESVTLAMMMYDSDRRTAGLGALDPRKRHGRDLSNTKSATLEGGVEYRLVRRTHDRVERIDPVLEDFRLGISYKEQRFEQRLVRGRVEERVLPVSRDRIRSQSGRSYVAHELRRARREIQSARGTGYLATA